MSGHAQTDKTEQEKFAAYVRAATIEMDSGVTIPVESRAIYGFRIPDDGIWTVNGVAHFPGEEVDVVPGVVIRYTQVGLLDGKVRGTVKVGFGKPREAVVQILKPQMAAATAAKGIALPEPSGVADGEVLLDAAGRPIRTDDVIIRRPRGRKGADD